MTSRLPSLSSSSSSSREREHQARAGVARACAYATTTRGWPAAVELALSSPCQDEGARQDERQAVAREQHGRRLDAKGEPQRLWTDRRGGGGLGGGGGGGCWRRRRPPAPPRTPGGSGAAVLVDGDEAGEVLVARRGRDVELWETGRVRVERHRGGRESGVVSHRGGLFRGPLSLDSARCGVGMERGLEWKGGEREEAKVVRLRVRREGNRGSRAFLVRASKTAPPSLGARKL